MGLVLGLSFWKAISVVVIRNHMVVIRKNQTKPACRCSSSSFQNPSRSQTQTQTLTESLRAERRKENPKLMRNSWRLLLLRSASRSSIINSSRFQSQHLQVSKLDPQTSRYFSSCITANAQTNNFLVFDSDIRNVKNRFFSSDSDKYKDQDVLAQIFSKSSSSEAIREELDSLKISITHDMILESLKNLKDNHENAWRLFNWVSLNESERLSSKSYNLILGNLGRKKYIKDFWNVVEVMRKKGYGLCKGAYVKVSENFEKEEMVSDLTRLNEWFASKSSEDPTTRVCKVIREHEWDEQVQKRLGELNISWSGDVVETVLEQLSVHPMKALMFFWWIEETPSFKHTEKTYNAMIKVLGREDCIDKFWRVVDEMKGAGYAMEKETYVAVMGRFYKRRMNKDAVDLYEFMMQSPNKPSDQDAVFLLRKIVASKDLDMELFSRVIRIFTEGGNSLKKSLFYGVLKSLASVGRLQECGKVLKAMEKGGFVANSAVHSEVIFQLSHAGKDDECYDILKEIETSGSDPNFNKTWVSMIHGQCKAGYVDAASSCFRKMVVKNGVTNAAYPLELLVNAFCRKRRAGDAFKFLSVMVDAKQLQPWHSTYKMLIQKLLVRGNLKEALSLIGLMKNDGFPPFLDPFISYISKSGSGDDAISFLEAISVKKCPSTSVFIQMFEGFFKAGRHNEAQDCLSKCPGYIRSHADVLNLFFERKPEEAVDDAAGAVVAA